MTAFSTLRKAFNPVVARNLTSRGAGLRIVAAGSRRWFASGQTTPFPSLTITKDAVTAQGAFAEQQSEFLNPDQQTASNLARVLKEKNIGVVAHFYMDAELQGTLVKIKNEWEHVFCADSLAMGFAAVEMAKKGVKAIACLGVDFMSESVKAVLDQNGFKHVPVFRLKEEHIGCSLAASAEAQAYDAYLKQCAATLKNPLHVIYINTSLQTKAKTHNIIPTITCTSSNVVRTILQAAAEMPDVNICYGPDTYMGENIQQLFETLVKNGDDEAIKALHPEHNVQTIQRLLGQYHFFKQGICVVHHMFGGEVTDKVKREYPIDDNTFYTAHFEVPGEMFTIASEAATQSKGVVGSTSNILNFIVEKAQEPFADEKAKRFILGTESGMITGIVKNVQDVLREPSADPKAKIEIVFPVAAEAVAQTENADMPIVPGVKGGEGCSTAGGCATCPFMKMNDLDSLVDLADQLPVVKDGEDYFAQIPANISAQCARVPEGGKTPEGYNIIDGTIPISYMRTLMSSGTMDKEMVDRVLSMQGPVGQEASPRRSASM